MKFIGGIAGLLLVTKIVAHTFLLLKVDQEFTLFTVNPFIAKRQAITLLLPVLSEVPDEYLPLKIMINIMYVLAVLGIVSFSIWATF